MDDLEAKQYYCEGLRQVDTARISLNESIRNILINIFVIMCSIMVMHSIAGMHSIAVMHSITMMHSIAEILMIRKKYVQNNRGVGA